jgi:hypothetical protein
MDDATNEHYSMFFVPEEGTASSFQGVREVIVSRGLFSSLYTEWTGLQTGTISLILCDISWQYMKCSCWDLRGMNGSCDCL